MSTLVRAIFLLLQLSGITFLNFQDTLVCVWGGGDIHFMLISLQHTGPCGVKAMPSANGLVGTGFASRYRLQPRAGF